jgi:hypothetical protein
VLQPASKSSGSNAITSSCSGLTADDIAAPCLEISYPNSEASDGTPDGKYPGLGAASLQYCVVRTTIELHVCEDDCSLRKQGLGKELPACDLPEYGSVRSNLPSCSFDPAITSFWRHTRDPALNGRQTAVSPSELDKVQHTRLGLPCSSVEDH